ncbi:UDP-2,4-diacetamido-2,4,6-trideoxy-beta-L-altropyranose hydrolase [Pseudidiomarina sp. CB1]|uniref:UDP-2,4-diacetamido-2,4, 6-trideoxy-beta-L-altropyranose hydrolase n=1 Tax=Pseudidiomarina sp. CB1 TaxID=2972484 RepID=UPI002161A3E1|nr:UDP-2,4-diacetamido-2,4,6-trideoxy-beta-L-altropyranose hydrolase [Pseudidiomarina sp. CB1]
MKVVFRVDASLEMGSGHTMRCLTLADALKTQGHECEFIVREQPGHLINLIKSKGYIVRVLPQLYSDLTTDIDEYSHSHWLPCGQQQDSEETLSALDRSDCDWLVVDHYGIGAQWEKRLRKVCRHILVIDDLADREHQCDVLLDQNIGRKTGDYDGLLPHKCLRMIGPQYALLRPEFVKWRKESLARRVQQTELRKILISLGGVDKDNVTGDVLDALEVSSLSDSVELTVVLGQQNPWLEKSQGQAALSRFDVTVIQGVTNMAEVMSHTDLAIGAAGSTSWERCCLGLPTVMLVLADNQKGIAKGLEKARASIVVGVANITSTIEGLLKDPVEMRLMSERAEAVCDGSGVIHLINVLERYSES